MSTGQTAVTVEDNRETQPVEAKLIQDLRIHGVDRTEPAQSTRDHLSHAADEREQITQIDPEDKY